MLPNAFVAYLKLRVTLDWNSFHISAKTWLQILIKISLSLGRICFKRDS